MLLLLLIPVVLQCCRQRQEAALAAKEREAEIQRHLQRLTEEPPGLSSTPEAALLPPQQVSLDFTMLIFTCRTDSSAL